MEEWRDKLRGGRPLFIRISPDGLPNGGRRIPPSGAIVGDDIIGIVEAVCRYLMVRCWGSAGVGGTAWIVLSLAWLEAPESGVVIDKPRLLGRFLGGLGGTTKEGVGGAEKAWFEDPSGFVRSDNLGSCGICRVVAVVLTDKFFVFLIFLLGESARYTPGRFPNGLAGEPALSGVLIVAIDVVLNDLNDGIGSRDVADSGEELGDGSVRAESIVETVVVGEDSAVEAESLRKSCDEILEF